MASGRIRIGISGWRYPRWRGRFYPKGLAQRRELEHASRCFSTVELNGSFYSLQHPDSYRRWYDETPDDFVFAVKGSRYITHMLRLKGVEEALATFFAQGLLALGGKLGPLLWQFRSVCASMRSACAPSSTCCRPIPGRRPDLHGGEMRPG